jgi:hypothetical protein
LGVECVTHHVLRVAQPSSSLWHIEYGIAKKAITVVDIVPVITFSRHPLG